MNKAVNISVMPDTHQCGKHAKNTQLVFLVGLPRSGTTWLQKLLGSHPEIGTAQESHLFNHFVGKQIQSWDQMIAFEDGRGGIGIPAYQLESEFMDMMHRQIREVLSHCHEYEKGSIFLEKTPDHIRHILDIQRVVPDAKIILMLRDPADIIESMLSAGSGWGRHWAPSSVIRAIRLCHYFIRKASDDYSKADHSSIHIVHYEKLKKDPNSTLTDILDFMKLESSVQTIELMKNTQFELHRYGEFAQRSGSIKVEEPEGFSRKYKGSLNIVQWLLIKATIGRTAFFCDVAASKQTLATVSHNNIRNIFQKKLLQDGGYQKIGTVKPESVPLDARGLFDRVSAIALIILLLPLISWRAIVAKRNHGRVFDVTESLSKHGSKVSLRRFSGLHAGRNLGLLFSVASGSIAWVGTSAGRQPLCKKDKAMSVLRPGLICRERLRRQLGIEYQERDSQVEIDYSLGESISIILQFAVASIIAPSSTARVPAKLNYLGVTIHNHTIESALAVIRSSVESGRKAKYAFVNPDCLNKTYDDPQYKAALNAMDSVFADGSGLQLAARLLGDRIKANVNGTDLFPLLCKQCVEKEHSLFLLGARDEIAQMVAKNMQNKYPGLKIVGTQHGYFTKDDESDVIEQINASKADIVLVAFGAPNQERWMTEHRASINATVLIGVGGLFDFFSGRISRSPKILQDMGLEWVWRLLQEPRRMWRRYIIGNPLFLYRIWKQSNQESGARVVKRFTNNSLNNQIVRHCLLHIGYFLTHWTQRITRRILDIFVSSIALVLLLLPLLFLSAVIKLESPGPIFFKQKRVGKWGVLFNMYKFRSMCEDAEHLKKSLADKNEMEQGVLFKMKDDPRITKTGKFIRKFSIDELPQLWNVLKGDMALVGPRPPVPQEVAEYTIDDRRRLEIKPGITCIWQVSGRSDIPFPKQVQLDLDYIYTHSFITDIKILLRTVPAVLKGKGAY